MTEPTKHDDPISTPDSTARTPHRRLAPSFFQMPFIGKKNERMPDGRRFVSMRAKFVGVLLITGVAVLLAALVLIPLSWQIFRGFYMKPENAEHRMEKYIQSFATYVAEEGVTSDNAAAVVDWTRRNSSVYLSIFRETDEQFGAAGGELWEGSARPDIEPFFDRILRDDDEVAAFPEGTLYTVRFADGMSSVAIVDYSHSRAYDILLISGILIAMAVFFVVVLIYYHRQIRDLVTLAHEVEAVSGGATDGIIASDRNDEIGMLARDVDTMRNTVLAKMREEERARQAGSDLITSMTHDLRTPLTTLLGYMELLGNEQESANLTDEQRAYIRVCAAKAEQIKELSDKLFLYFWAYTCPEDEGELEPFEADLLFGQLIGDYIPAMEAAGLAVDSDLRAIPAGMTVSVRPDCLRRVTDNLFDNLVKYADPARPVRVTARMENTHMILRMENTPRPADDRSTGTRIGHKTCRNMMELMHGTFIAELTEDLFIAELQFPIEAHTSDS